MGYPSAEHDRMIAAMLLPCVVVGVDLIAGRVRVKAGTWVSAWVRWHSLAAGKARHWRAPSPGEQGALFSPSGDPAMGTFIPGLYGNAGAPPDNRDHVEAWYFDDGGSLIYDWQAGSYSIDLPNGSCATIKVGESLFEVTPDQVRVAASQIALAGEVTIDGSLNVSGDINGAGTIMDAGGNSNHHSH
ncbi:phage baseplate assembly protein V [Pseudomonas sp. FW300-N1A1]|uniref:phage baseplate assembly protein V n=1 Tax=Pseudomonas sp. FW300-N1A1 TaxID=2075555 RepID=UPI000CD27B54|nr:phage baseplate assembly protein V [Pseudomonas sp. FW300-N1A1]POA21524.1 phage baseplate assembly protein V [Pseudomonas sp. FW300-N1A1]